MKTLICSMVLVAVVMFSGQLQAQDKWFDMENCAICKCMSEHKDVMKEMKWDAYPIANGMVMVSVVPEKHKAVMAEAHEKMMATVAKLEQGEPMDLCGFCSSYGMLKQSGASFDELETVGGQLTVVTSSDDDVVAKIHEHAKRSHVEREKMLKTTSKSSGK